jgi:hypothetical protein
MSTVQFWPASGGGGGHVIQEEGTGLTQRSKLNFVGTTVTATDDAANDRTVVTIAGATAPARATASFTTGTLANAASGTGTVNLGAGYILYKITTDQPCRVRLYTTGAKRDSDLLRAAGTIPSGDHGLILDFVSTSTLLSADLTPQVDGYDVDADGLVAYSVVNLSGTSNAITVSFTYLKTEG